MLRLKLIHVSKRAPEDNIISVRHPSYHVFIVARLRITSPGHSWLIDGMLAAWRPSRINSLFPAQAIHLIYDQMSWFTVMSEGRWRRKLSMWWRFGHWLHWRLSPQTLHCCQWEKAVNLMVLFFCILLLHIYWSNSQIPGCTCSISHNAPFRTEMCTFLFWMEHCGIWNRFII